MKSQPSSAIKVVFLVVTFLVIALSITYVFNQDPILRNRSDFFVRWYASTKLFQEQRNIYSTLNGSEVDTIIYGLDNDNISLDFYYPAHILLFVAPLSLLDYKTAHFIWTFATQIFLLIALLVMMKAANWPQNVDKSTIYVLLVLLSYPMLLHTYWGQFNTIGVLALALTYYFITKDCLTYAGIAASGLTFKPHPYIAVIIFLLFSIQSYPSRNRFNISFIASLFFMWAIAEFLQPGWIISFIRSLNGYPQMQSVIDSVWNPYQIVSIGLILFLIVIFFRNSAAKIDSAQFSGCLVMALSVWALIFPFILTFHVFGLALVQIPLINAYKKYFPKYYLSIIYLLILIYCLGWVGGRLELFNNEWFIWTQVVYKVIYPVVLTVLAVPLCFLPLRTSVTSAVKN